MRKPVKPLLNRLVAATFDTLWLALRVKKPSHKIRMKQAKRVFARLQCADFQENGGRLFAYVRAIDPFVFEELLLLAFKARGLKVIHNRRYTGDGGIDGVVVLPNKQRYAIQAKRYKDHVNAQAIKNFATDLTRHSCSGGFFIHSGKSGASVYHNLPSNVTMISGGNLYRLLVFKE